MRKRPAETLSLTAALAVLLAYFLGVPQDVSLALSIVCLAVLPGLVTAVVERVRK